MSSDIELSMTESEAKNLWRLLSGHDLDLNLSCVRMRLESALWDRLSIEEMAVAGSLQEIINE